MTETLTAGASLYRRIGGHEPLVAVVDLFYRRVVADDELAPLFAHTNLEDLRRHQASFLGAALGGPRTYAGRSLREAHRGLGITAQQFGLVAGHLDAALDACGVAASLRAEILALIAPLREAIVEEEAGDAGQER